jgi:hypothetical protein
MAIGRKLLTTDVGEVVSYSAFIPSPASAQVKNIHTLEVLSAAKCEMILP